ncbi:MAG: di-trans,poly-cis-decaprenylcistransferase [Clostridia bacterium]|nr:di-trans,poly-cis-decaprenylcistransferase [Clostridia bacterium]
MFGWNMRKTKAIPMVLPRHIGIIMDGNGRWAKKRGLPRTAGHSVGAKTFEDICRYANSLGVENMTFYAFSTENWKRPKEEVDTLMRIFKDYLGRASQFQKEKIRIRFVGDPTPLSDELRQLMKEAEEASCHFTGLTVYLAINYGGRDELLHSVKALGTQIQSGARTPADLTVEDITGGLYQPLDVDLLIRPGGEQRLSNFLLWQCAYGEFYFCDTLWPDFSRKEFDAALMWYTKRNRRFGGI